MPAIPALPDEETAARFAGLALECIHREYPNKISHVLESDADARPPRELTPVFYGCYDWHSAVHGHWMLVRLLRFHPGAGFAGTARAALAASFTAERAEGELAYLSRSARAGFERPYGLAWLLQLTAELREWDDPVAREWLEVLIPLEATAVARLNDWLPKLDAPIRGGEHFQTAFAFGLIWDWAQVAGDADMLELLRDRARHHYLEDRDCPLAYEPSGHDFLSPCLAEADFVRRLLKPEAFGAWLQRFMPGIPQDGSGGWLEVAVVTDATDGKLAHLDGLNISRAWMLQGIAEGLPDDDARRSALTACAERHAASGLAAVTGEHYEGGHWLGSFATYLVTRRGLYLNPQSTQE